MKVVLLLGLVGAPIYGAILLSYDLLPHDPAANVFTGQSLGNLDDRQLRSWGTDLPALASQTLRKHRSHCARLRRRPRSLPPLSLQPTQVQHTRQSNGQRSSLPRRCTATPQLPRQYCASINPVPRCGLSGDKTDGSRSPIPLPEQVQSAGTAQQLQFGRLCSFEEPFGYSVPRRSSGLSFSSISTRSERRTLVTLRPVVHIATT